MTLENLWYPMMGIIFLAFIGVLFYSKDRKYIFYFITGGITGFYLDLVSVTQGYYSYYPYFPHIFGVPLTVTISEGSSVAITIFLYKEIISKALTRLLRK
ncbi:hypothetical protein HYU20_02325 [Candidatus Woesearchaeota archaeon]|nr:hypothetical protein [Candidatus Woesearchaeota archaeon]